jgi:hypothetical protein
MIFDDHEITDDWNMRLRERIKTHTSALGRRVVQNGLVAYALCQHWGNRPEEFMPRGGAQSPGAQLLQELNGKTGVQYGGHSDDIAKLVGLPPPLQIASRQRLFHQPSQGDMDPGSLTYHYTVEGPAHQILITDTRTWRSFPNRNEYGAVLLDDEQLDRQVRSVGLVVPPLNGRMQLVVLSTNAPPIRAIRAAEKLEGISNWGKHYPDIYESWQMPASESDKLYKALSDRLPDLGGVKFGAAVLLSGDTHHSFATRLRLEGSARLGDAQGQGQPVHAVFAQLVSSSFRNEDADTRQIGLEGHDYKPGWKHIVIPKGREERLYGWNIAPGTTKTVGAYMSSYWKTDREGNTFEIPVAKPFKIDRSQTIGGDFHHLLRRLFVDEGKFESNGSHNWEYHLEYLKSAPEGSSPPRPAPPPLGPYLTEQDRKASIAFYVNSLAGYRQVVREGTNLRETVGVNNLSEITFSGTTTDLKVHHTMRWCASKPPLNVEIPWPELHFVRIPVELWPLAPQ